MTAEPQGGPTYKTNYYLKDSHKSLFDPIVNILNEHLIKNAPSTFLIRVQGKSMNSVGIHNDDLLIVDKSLNPKNFSTVIANINEELVVKTFVKEKKESFLTSGSKRSKDKINLTENPEIVIWGIVTHVIHAL